ncbi:hypothetical protein IP91_02570 [Pseudoduganella lurida]|uniref:Uncharacterized protein n=2 Tax=Pseudoduganella lurida TaxID=1036180 RepID=A0A562R8F5_9BURK|nr:hypothetical protein IP91_02570 [Pseudoduganella lurida]
MLAGSAAAALTFLFMWPHTRREAFVRITCAIAMSSTAGPLVIVAIHSCWPELFASARTISMLLGAPEEVGVLYVSAPLMAVSGLPAWWLLGGLVRWLDKRKDKDIGEMAHDVAEVVKDMRGGL